MGTYFRVVSNCPSNPSATEFETELDRVEQVMSNYRADSTVSQFNRHPVDSWFPVEPSLVEVIAIAERVSSETQGRLDVTIEPLVAAWGFGPQRTDVAPTDETVQRLLASVDYQALEYRFEPSSLLKKRPLSIDLSAIAKGFGVDQLAEVLSSMGCTDFLVDVGGEIRVQGRNANLKPWQIGIEYPDGSGRVFKSLQIVAGAVATTGSYRNVRTLDSGEYTHILDPHTGYPVEHDLASVTVWAETTAEADALATALFVMGTDEGYKFASTDNVAAMFFTRAQSSETVDVLESPAMQLKTSR